MPTLLNSAETAFFEDLFIVNIGEQDCPPQHAYGPAKRAHFLIHFVLSGRGKLHCDQGVFDVGPGQGFLIMPDETTFYQADEKDPWFYTWIAFSGSICEKTKKMPSVVTINNGKIFEEISKLVAEGVCYPEKYLICLIKHSLLI